MCIRDRLYLGHTVEKVEENEQSINVLLKDGTALQADMVVMALGVTPDTKLAKAAGLELGIKESILVDERMETSVADIYAVGDAVQVKHSVTGADVLISLAGPANRQGRIAADNICGGKSIYHGSQGSSVTVSYTHLDVYKRQEKKWNVVSRLNSMRIF